MERLLPIGQAEQGPLPCDVGGKPGGGFAPDQLGELIAGHQRVDRATATSHMLA